MKNKYQYHLKSSRNLETLCYTLILLTSFVRPNAFFSFSRENAYEMEHVELGLVFLFYLGSRIKLIIQ